MKIANYKEIKLEDVNAEGAINTKIRWMISEKDGAPNFALRMFEVEVGGQTPYHQHAWEHEVFVLEGEGEFVTERGVQKFGAWDCIYVDPDMMHQFKNVGKGIMRFLCIIPHEPKKEAPKKVVNPFAAGKANNC
ncbi:MAG: cupin domain-containing protein [Candidatus Cloacimonetes bacterium]|nr:cupin domain-containing protein [Candidatus Cloacimonadota bacterium]